MTSIVKTARELAVEVLESIFEDDAYSNLKLDQVLKQNKLDIQDRNLVTNLVYGVLQHKLSLDFQLQPYLKKPKKLAPWLPILLESAVYQMQYLDRIPTRAVIFESVQIAKKRGQARLGNLVNAVLRNIQRNGWRDVAQISDPKDRLSIQYSVPLPLVTVFIAQLGLDKTATVLSSLNQPPKVSLRVNTSLTTVDAVLAWLKEAGYEAKKSVLSPVGVVVEGGHIAETELFADGRIVLQDESAQLAALALQVEPDNQVLDACAAPGGKTTQIATTLKAGIGQVIALDQYPNKIKLINQNAKRQKLAGQIISKVLDARKIETTFPVGTFDRILVDAPCSGIGLLRRKPEIRYRKDTQDFEQLQKLQLQILDATAETLKIGGHLVYSTCTIIQQENEQVIAQFLKTHPNFTLEITATENKIKADRSTAYLTIYPDDYDSDGFFIASLQRNS